MSLAALNYMMELEEFPDGSPLNAMHKVVGLVLANAHNGHTRLCWPSTELISRKARLSLRTVQRTLAEMETHGIIRRTRPDRQGRTHITEYVFSALPAFDQSVSKKHKEGRQCGTRSPSVLVVSGNREGCQRNTLIAERVTEGCHPRQKRVTEGCHPQPPYKEEPGTVLTENHEPLPVSDEPAPESSAPEQYVQRVFEELSLVLDRGTFDVVSQSLVILGKIESLPLNKACDTMVKRGRAAAADGVTINRFWFTDRKFLDIKKHASAAVPSPGEIMRRQLALDGY
jgi:hypothetical protein